MKKALTVLFILLCANISAQDFGFGFDNDDAETSSSSAVSLKANGGITMELPLYLYNFAEQEISFWDMVSGKFRVSVHSPQIEIFTSYNLNSASISELWKASPNLGRPNYTPLIIDEAFLRAYIGPVSVEAGFRKLSWGKADGSGPLDVINPVDYTDLRHITDIMANKIARPMIHAVWNTGNFSKLEGVFIPNFTGHRFAQEGRWTPAQFSNMPTIAADGIYERALQNYPAYASLITNMFSSMSAGFSDFQVEYPNTSSLDYFQAGLRYTATTGPCDIGIQYFYGNLFSPNFTIAGVDSYLNDLINGVMGANPPLTLNPYYHDKRDLLSPQIKYTRYHQIGFDYAQVLQGFNVRAELAFNITEDTSGSNGSLQNPFIGWSLGFDRELIYGINVNFQCNESIRLFNGKIGDNPVLDSQAGTNPTSTRLTMQLSKKFFRDNLESKATFIWDIENSDCYIIPALFWTEGNITFELSGGVFAGKKTGELGQYRENSFVRLGLMFLF